MSTSDLTETAGVRSSSSGNVLGSLLILDWGGRNSSTIGLGVTKSVTSVLIPSEILEILLGDIRGEGLSIWKEEIPPWLTLEIPDRTEVSKELGIVSISPEISAISDSANWLWTCSVSNCSCSISTDSTSSILDRTDAELSTTLFSVIEEPRSKAVSKTEGAERDWSSNVEGEDGVRWLEVADPLRVSEIPEEMSKSDSTSPERSELFPEESRIGISEISLVWMGVVASSWVKLVVDREVVSSSWSKSTVSIDSERLDLFDPGLRSWGIEDSVSRIWAGDSGIVISVLKLWDLLPKIGGTSIFTEAESWMSWDNDSVSITGCWLSCIVDTVSSMIGWDPGIGDSDSITGVRVSWGIDAVSWIEVWVSMTGDSEIGDGDWESMTGDSISGVWFSVSITGNSVVGVWLSTTGDSRSVDNDWVSTTGDTASEVIDWVSTTGDNVSKVVDPTSTSVDWVSAICEPKSVGVETVSETPDNSSKEGVCVSVIGDPTSVMLETVFWDTEVPSTMADWVSSINRSSSVPDEIMSCGGDPTSDIWDSSFGDPERSLVFRVPASSVCGVLDATSSPSSTIWLPWSNCGVWFTSEVRVSSTIPSTSSTLKLPWSSKSSDGVISTTSSPMSSVIWLSRSSKSVKGVVFTLSSSSSTGGVLLASEIVSSVLFKDSSVSSTVWGVWMSKSVGGVPSTSTSVVGDPSTSTSVTGDLSTSKSVGGVPSTSVSVVGDPSTSISVVSVPSTFTSVTGDPSTSKSISVTGVPSMSKSVGGVPSMSTSVGGVPSTSTSVGGVPSTSTSVGGVPSTSTSVGGVPSTSSTSTFSVPTLSRASESLITVPFVSDTLCESISRVSEVSTTSTVSSIGRVFWRSSSDNGWDPFWVVAVVGETSFSSVTVFPLFPTVGDPSSKSVWLTSPSTVSMSVDWISSPEGVPCDFEVPGSTITLINNLKLMKWFIQDRSDFQIILNISS